MVTIKKTSKAIIMRWGGYVFAVAIVALATWLKFLTKPDIIPADIPVLYILAIVLTSFFFGLGPSIWCCILSVFAYDFYFLPPVHDLISFHILEVPVTLIFLFTGIVISYLSSRLRKRTEEARKEVAVRRQSEAELIIYRTNLEEMVRQRTAELEKANLDLKKDEEALRESEERFRAIAETTPIQISVIRVSDGKILYTNRAYYEAFGFKEGELKGHRAPDLYANPADRDALVKTLEEQGTLQNYEIRVKRTDGKLFWVSVSGRKIHFGGEESILGASIDITKRKEAEEALNRAHAELEIRIRERTRELAEANKSLEMEITGHKQAREALQRERKRFFDVLETMPAMICLLTPDYHVAFANRSFREQFGESEGRHCYKYCFGKTGPCEFCQSYEVLKTGRPHHWELTLPNGTVIDAHDYPFTDVDGSPLILKMDIDITEQKRAQAELRQAHSELEMRVEERTKELRETRDYLDNLMNYANAPIIVWNPEFRITRFNHAFERLTGRTSDEMLGKTLDILFPEDSRDESLKHIRTATSGVRWEVVEIPIVHKDGTVRILLWNSATLFAEDGRTVVATIAQGQDITERKKTEQMKDEFISLVSHELRTPMTIITGSLRTAEAARISHQEKDMLIKNAIDGADSLSAILENLLELSRYQTGRLQIHREPINVSDIAVSVVNGLKTRNDGHRFLMDIPGDLPPVEADHLRVERILYNLVENATKYSPPRSTIEVSSRVKEGEVITGVTNEGTGITPEEQSRIFAPFERLGKDGTIRSGLGLGLVVCKRLVEAHGGRIWVESEPGKGCTFYFSLPLYKKTA
jgi:PAS domain S-box-containing protein